MFRSLIALATFVVVAAPEAAHAQVVSFTDVPTVDQRIVTLTGGPSSGSAAGYVQRSATITGAVLQDVLASAIAGSTPVLEISARAFGNGHKTKATFTHKTAFVDTCTGPTNCFSNVAPTSGDFVTVTVTLTDGTTSTRHYGNFANGTSTGIVRVVSGLLATETVDLSMFQTVGLDALGQGLTTDRCEIESIEMTINLDAFTVTNISSGSIGSISWFRLRDIDTDGDSVIDAFNALTYTPSGATCP